MRRPSRTGLLVALALAIPVVVEFRTLLVWLGVDAPLRIYAPTAALVLVAAAAAIWFLSEDEPRRA